MDQRPSVYRRDYTGLSSWAQWEMLCRNYIDFVPQIDELSISTSIRWSISHWGGGSWALSAASLPLRWAARLGAILTWLWQAIRIPPASTMLPLRSNIARNPPHIWDPDGPQRTAKLKMRINQKKNLGCMKFAKDALDCQRVFLGLR